MCKIGQNIKDLEFRPGKIAKSTCCRHKHVIVLTSSQILMLLRNRVPEYHLAKFGDECTTNRGET